MAKDHRSQTNDNESDGFDTNLTSESMDLPGGEKPPIQAPFGSHPRKYILRKTIIVCFALLIVGAAGFLVWKYLLSSGKESQDQGKPAQSNVQAPENNIVEELTETFDAPILRVTLKYPRSWAVSEKERVVLVISPSFKYQANDGSEVDGNVFIYITKGAKGSDSDYLGRGITVKPSEKLNYTDPLPGQLDSTYLTSFGIDEPDNFSYFIVQGNFNLKKGDTLGPDYGKEPDAFLIGGGFSSGDSEGGLDGNQVSLDSYESYQYYKTAIEIVKTLQLK